MNSPIKFLRRVRIHGGECGAVARALHHKAKFSSPAVFENVSSTTYERKQMTNKSTSFKRLALALVAALGFGVLSTGPSAAVLSAATTTLSSSATAVSVTVGETASVTLTVNFTSTAIQESVNIITSAAPSNVTATFRGLTTDSINVRTGVGIEANQAVTAGFIFSVFGNNNPDSVVTAASTGMYIPSSAANTTPLAVQAKVSLNLAAATNASAGVTDMSITLRGIAAGTATNYQVVNLRVTVLATDIEATAAKSKLYVNKAICNDGLCTSKTNSGGSAFAIEADSTLVVSSNAPSAGGTMSYTAVGYMFGIFNNAADTKTTTSGSVTGTLTVSLSGPGMLSSVGTATKAKSLTLTASSDTITIWSDGTAGTATITGYIGSTALTQAAKTVVFFGKVASVTLSETTVASRHGGAALSSDAADSLTVGTNLVTFTMKDAAGNAVTSTSLNANGLFCTISDTSIVQTGTGSGAAALLNYEAPTVTAAGVGSCNLVVRKAGSVTITVSDDSVVANSTFSAAKTLTFAKAVNGTTKGIGKIVFDKTTYNVGEKATITITVLNADNAVPGLLLNGGDAYTTASVFPTLVQDREFSSVGTTMTGASLGFGTARTDKSISLTGSSFVAGVETYVVYMPTIAGDLTITGFTTDGTYDTATAVSVTLKVLDPNAALIAASQAATVAAAEAATDAAAEAIDAANAATDAANLAAEAADAATVAAEEARDAADAATAAVEELATQVATLMAALKAQITTLANTVAKIAKKVKA
jgi:hypothetical protein